MNGINISAEIRLSDEKTIQAIRNHVPGGEQFASPEQVEKAFIVLAETEQEKKELKEFIWNHSENKEPDWSSMPFQYHRINSPGQLASVMQPEQLEDHLHEANRFLVLKWKSSGYINITISGIAEE